MPTIESFIDILRDFRIDRRHEMRAGMQKTHSSVKDLDTKSQTRLRLPTTIVL